MAKYPRVASLKTVDEFRDHCRSLDIDIPVDAEADTEALAASLHIDGLKIGNRFAILPMEGWDGTADGMPSELTERRWENFGRSGAKWIWGGEAVAVRHDGRANPNQLIATESNMPHIGRLREKLVAAHQSEFGETSDLAIGLQLTHSGRYSRPNKKTVPEPRTAMRHEVLDRRLSIEDDSAMFSDDELKALADDFVAAAVRAEAAGFVFVDIKHCHGYLGHELLMSVDRKGDYGGSLDNRLRFFREIAEGIRSEAPTLKIGTRLSLFDFVPYGPGEDNVGRPEPGADPRLSFGCDDTGVQMDLKPTSELLTKLADMGVKMICTSAGIPYATPHLQRPATFPPSDGYDPPEDPLVGVTRQIFATAEMKKAHPEMAFIGSGYTYLQDYLAAVGGAVIRGGLADSIGLGRMVLSYPELPADVLAGESKKRKKICRTFSDCTTAPRNGMVSGCYPLDAFYKSRPEREALQNVKKELAAQSSV